MKTALRFGVLAVAVCAAALRADDKPKPAEKPPEGFTALFDGKSLSGWKPTGKADAWGVEDGLIVCKGGGGGYLLTEKEYANFEFRCEYKWAKAGGNSGVGLRTPEKGDPAYQGMEIQLIDDEGWEGVHKSKLADYQHTGSIYDVQPAKAAKNKKIGEWNTVKIVCDGRKVTVTQNDVELVNTNLDDYKAKADKNHPGLKREKGHVGFQSYNVRVDFRNVYIKELK
ncbi:DUF1080 domain-containing protein [Gemmata sp. JC717]|uniref:3-keto-disaccharide hydrolase n=1 Tax=Gemmata algarum TaxID=2975278 RepID=UPI0021BB2845|nr:DUF1080 domain-containing protein [Gemmata algarum]MDY3556800.1 DUF1080 domain-containing protein [Gemmata algarum]